MSAVRLSGDYKYFVDQLKEAKEDFTISSTTKSKQIRTDEATYLFAADQFKFSDLALFQKRKIKFKKNHKL